MTAAQSLHLNYLPSFRPPTHRVASRRPFRRNALLLLLPRRFVEGVRVVRPLAAHTGRPLNRSVRSLQRFLQHHPDFPRRRQASLLRGREVGGQAALDVDHPRGRGRDRSLNSPARIPKIIHTQYFFGYLFVFISFYERIDA